MDIPANPTSSGQSINGKVSWFGGPGDSTDSGHTANGETTKTPGIAIYNRSTLGGYWKVTANNGKTAVLKQTDLGPAPFTGRAIDVTYSALGKFGYNESNFPTNSQFKATYLGHNPGASTPSTPSQTEPTAPSISSIPGAPTTTTSFDKAGYEKANRASIVGKLIAGEGGQKDNPLFASGLLSTKAPVKSEYESSKTVPGIPGVAKPSTPTLPGMGTTSPSGNASDVLKGFTVGRTDQGVDASAKPGTPITATGDAKILGIEPNWYAGQPFVYYELTSGPAKGRVEYVAEQIAPAVKAGDVVRAGEPIGHYATSGTGIERGFATKSGQTLAQATTGYREGEATKAGQEYAKLVKGH